MDARLHSIRLRSSLIVTMVFVILAGALMLARAANASHALHGFPAAHDSAPVAWADDQLTGPAALTTTHVLSGTTGSDDWYLSFVTVTLTVEDGGGGLAATLYRLDGTGWVTYSAPFLVAEDGTHALEYFSIDTSQRLEPTRTTQVRIDTTVPSSWVDVLPGHQTIAGFTVSWSGSDNAGSGLSVYDVQYKDGFLATWRDWITRTSAVSATFASAQNGHVYYFRSRAWDAAGNAEQYPGGRGDAQTYVESIANGGFESGSFVGWSVTGEMSTSLASAPTIGATGAINLTFSGLVAATKYLGSVAYSGATGMPNPTIVRVDMP